MIWGYPYPYFRKPPCRYIPSFLSFLAVSGGKLWEHELTSSGLGGGGLSFSDKLISVVFLIQDDQSVEGLLRCWRFSAEVAPSKKDDMQLKARDSGDRKGYHCTTNRECTWSFAYRDPHDAFPPSLTCTV